MYQKSLHFHFVGIGGSGMSGLAEILAASGFRVSGSDQADSAILDHLRSLGISISIGHAPGNLPEKTSLVVYSSAIRPDNPEMEEGRKRKIPLVPRAQILAELMRLKYGIAVAGAHGKTSTTSFISAVFEKAEMDPTTVVGGVVQGLGTGGKMGLGDFLIAESDESDRSFLLLRPVIAVVTNIDAEHLSAYGSEAALHEAFREFMNSVPFYGLLVVCRDDAVAPDLAASLSKRVVTYGFDRNSDLRAQNVEANRQQISFEVVQGEISHGRFEISVPGRHMVLNALASLCVALEVGISLDVARTALREFRGVKRRAEIIGDYRGITIMNDYGHHPTEIGVTLQGIREGWGEELTLQGGEFWVVFQPHRFSRTEECWDAFKGVFAKADHVLITDIYAAGESARDGINSEALTQVLNHPRAHYIPSAEAVIAEVKKRVKPGDLILTLGAGSVGQWGPRILEAIKGSRDDN